MDFKEISLSVRSENSLSINLSILDFKERRLYGRKLNEWSINLSILDFKEPSGGESSGGDGYKSIHIGF